MKHKDKYIVSVAVLLTVVFVAVADEEDDARSFMQDINAAWTNREYSLIYSIIESHLQTNATDVLPLSVKPFYYFVVEPNITNAHLAAGAFTNAVYSSARTELREMACRIVEPVVAIPESETIAYSSEQRDNLHVLFPDAFPYIERCVGFALQFNKSRDVTVTSEPVAQAIPIKVSRWDECTQQDGTTTFTRIYFEDADVEFTAPATFSNLVFESWSKDGSPYSTNVTVSFTVESNATWTVAYTNAP